MTWTEFLALLTDSEQIIRVGGLALLTAVVFAETGIPFFFFLPGDYLLFTAGLLNAKAHMTDSPVLDVPLTLLLICLFGAAVFGNLTGFLLGRYLGIRLETMRDRWYFKRAYMDNTRAAFTKYGANALVVGRFLPVVRTFAPILAGATGFDMRRFILLNLVGGAAWVLMLVLAGYYLGWAFPNIVNYLEYIIIGFIAITTLILLRGYWRLRAERRRAQTTLPTGTPPPHGPRSN